MKILKVTQTVYDSLSRLIVKAWNGRSDTRTAIEASPYGVDSNPVKDMVAIYAKTELDGNEYIVGYLNKNRLSDTGEVRLFSTNALGVLQTYIWLKNDGTIRLGGNIDNAVRYIPLNAALQSQATAINVELAKIAVALNAIVPGSYTPTPITINVSSAKINNIKTL